MLLGEEQQRRQGMEAETRKRSQSYPARVDKSGRVGIPAELRSELGLSDNYRVLWVKDGSGVRIETPEEALKSIAGLFRGPSAQVSR